MKNMKHVLAIKDLDDETIHHILHLSSEFKSLKKQGKPHHYLQGKNIVLLFQKDSTRTRSAFEIAAIDLGMYPMYIGSSGSQMGKKESMADTAQVLSRMFDGIQFRGYHHADIEEIAKYATVPVWNGLTDRYHPTQAFADIMTIQEYFPNRKVKIVYLGNVKNNVAVSLMHLSLRLGYDFTGIGPMDHMPNDDDIKLAKVYAKTYGGTFELTTKLDEGMVEASVVYTDVWVSMGESKTVWKERLTSLMPYQVNKNVMKLAQSDAIFLHCLPAFHDDKTELAKEIIQSFKDTFNDLDKGLEVTDDVFSSSASKVFDQAENRLHTIKAIMYESLTKD